jgi:CBS domain-containing protein
MKVREVMTPDPTTCGPTDNLGTAVWRMWKGDCGFLPVIVDDMVVGVVTDRDAAISLMLRGRRPEEVMVGEIMQGHLGVVACSPDDSVQSAMDLMRDHQLHRLPVVAGTKLVGVVSLNDLALASGASGGSARRPTYRDVAQTLRGVCAHRLEARAA